MKAPILRKETLAPGISRMVLSAPEVAAHAAAGQFIILRPTENGERIPLTISDFDPKAGTVTIVYQVVGGTTLLLDSLHLKKRGAVLGDGIYKQKRAQNKVGRALFAVGACHM